MAPRRDPHRQPDDLRDTGDEKYLTWFERTLDYCKEHFSDPEYGDWYGYLRRDGKPTMPRL